jgi:hypothetical protein
MSAFEQSLWTLWRDGHVVNAWTVVRAWRTYLFSLSVGNGNKAEIGPRFNMNPLDFSA